MYCTAEMVSYNICMLIFSIPEGHMDRATDLGREVNVLFGLQLAKDEDKAVVSRVRRHFTFLCFD